MSTLKASGRRVVMKRPVGMLFVSNRDQEFNLEEVLDALWNSPLIEVTRQAIDVLTSQRFVITSNLKTRALLRDTIFHDDWPGDEKVYERLFQLYLDYSYGHWWCARWPKDIPTPIYERRRRRVQTTARLFLVKLYCAEGGNEEKGNFGGFYPLLKVVVRDLMRIRLRSSPTKAEEQGIITSMLLRFVSSFEGASKHSPKKEGEGLERALILIARLCSSTLFYDQEVIIRFRRLAQAVERGAVVRSMAYESSEMEKEIEKRKLAMLVNLVCDEIKENKHPKARLKAA
jgi:hypothetical protein